MQILCLVCACVEFVFMVYVLWFMVYGGFNECALRSGRHVRDKRVLLLRVPPASVEPNILRRVGTQGTRSGARV